MDQELIFALQSCADSCERLKQMIAQDQYELRSALGGDLLAEFLKGTDSAMKAVGKIKSKTLKLKLQEEQKI